MHRGISVTFPAPCVAHLSLDSPPVNILTLSLWRVLLEALRALEADATTTVLVISSALSRPIFSAGNDILELHAPSTTKERHREFWSACTQFLAALYKSSLYTIAAVRGACPAGGCIIALCCDERVVLNCGLSFGLNEASLGIPVPRYWAQLMLIVGGGRRAELERLVSLGELLDAQQALSLGLVDRVVETDVEKTAQHLATAHATRLRGKHSAFNVGRHQTKSVLRGQFAQAWRDFAFEEARQAWQVLCRPDVSSQLGRILSSLQSKNTTKTTPKL